MKVRRVCESYCLKLFDRSIAKDEDVQQKSKTTVESCALEEKKRLGQLKLSTPSN